MENTLDAVEIAACSIFFICSISTIVLTSLTLRKVFNLKSFQFLKKELLLIIIFEITVFFYALDYGPAYNFLYSTEEGGSIAGLVFNTFLVEA